MFLHISANMTCTINSDKPLSLGPIWTFGFLQKHIFFSSGQELQEVALSVCLSVCLSVRLSIGLPNKISKRNFQTKNPNKFSNKFLSCLPNKFSKRNSQTRFPNKNSKRNLQKKFPKEISKQNFQTEFPNESSKSSFQTEQNLLVIFRGGLQTVIPLLIRGVMAYVHRF